MRPTRRGVGVGVGGIGALFAGWLFAIPEMLAAGSAGIVLLVAATVLAGSDRTPTVRRSARPLRLPIGDRCDVALVAGNDRSRPTTVVGLRDRVAGSGTAQALLGPLRIGERVEAVYSLPTTRRGRFRIGPLQREVIDPFGLARRISVDDEVTTVMVLPRVVALAPMPGAVGDEPELGARSMVAASTIDEDFTGLRGYVAGDDVRRIHWPSSARSGAAMVRQFEVPWQHRSTVLVDLRASRHDAGSFERALTVAASVAALSATAGELLRFGTTAERDPEFVSAAEHFEPLLDRLALTEPVEQPGDGDAMVELIEHVTRTPTGRLVVCAGHLDAIELARVHAAAARAGFAIVVTTGSAEAGARIEAGGPAEAAGLTEAAGLIAPLPGAGRLRWDGDDAQLAQRWAGALRDAAHQATTATRRW